MKQKADAVLSQVDALLDEGYHMWEDFGLPLLSEEDKHMIAEYAATVWQQDHVKEYAAACQCFYLYRRLHLEIEKAPENATLLGDYFFSKFSHYLIPIDSTRLIDLFSEYLIEDIQRQEHGCGGFDLKAYLNFIKQTAEEIQL